ncbi:MAG TPA: hypothetical protein PLS79_22075 [Caldilinea sp.]|nr:hypothetical protein [Caldilinea sp.]
MVDPWLFILIDRGAACKAAKVKRGAAKVERGAAKVAVTFWSMTIEMMQAPVPVQAPLQPVKVEPVVWLAVSVTMVPKR